MARRPAFGGAVFCAGAESEHGLSGVEAVAGKRGGLALRVDLKARPAGIAVEFGLSGVRQRGVAVDHQGQRGFVELADVVEQKIA